MSRSQRNTRRQEALDPAPPEVEDREQAGQESPSILASPDNPDNACKTFVQVKFGIFIIVFS